MKKPPSASRRGARHRSWVLPTAIAVALGALWPQGVVLCQVPSGHSAMEPQSLSCCGLETPPPDEAASPSGLVAGGAGCSNCRDTKVEARTRPSAGRLPKHDQDRALARVIEVESGPGRLLRRPSREVRACAPPITLTGVVLLI